MMPSSDEIDLSPSGEEVQNATPIEDATLDDAEKMEETEFDKIGGTTPKPKVEPEAIKSNESDEQSFSTARNEESGVQSDQSERGSTDDDVPNVGTIMEPIEEQKKDDSSLPGGPKVFERQRSIDNEAVSDGKSQSSSSEDSGDDDGDTTVSDMKEVVPPPLTPAVTEHGVEVSTENQSDTLSSKSDSMDRQDREVTSSEAVGKDKSRQDTMKNDSEMKESLHSTDDIQSNHDPVGTKESPNIEKDERKRGSMEEAENYPERSLFEKSPRLNDLVSKPVTKSAFDSLHADIDSMREVSKNFETPEQAVSPERESNVEKSADNVGGKGKGDSDKRTEMYEPYAPTAQDNLFKENEVSEETSSKDSKLTPQSQEQNDRDGEQVKSEATSIGKKVKSDDESSKHSDESDSISSEDSSINDHSHKSNGVDEIRSKSHSSHGRSEHTNASPTLSSADNKEMIHLEDGLCGSTPSKIESNATVDQISSKDDDIESESRRDPELERLEELMRGSTPYENHSNSTLNGSILNEANLNSGAVCDKSSSVQGSDDQLTLSEKIMPSTNTPTDLMELVHASVAQTRPRDDLSPKQGSKPKLPTVQVSDSKPDLPAVAQDSEIDLLTPEYNSKLDVPSTILPNEHITAATPTADQDEGLSVFSNATSGQDFLRSVSNAKKKLDEIDKEMKELKEVSNNPVSDVVDNINNRYASSKREMPTTERKHSDTSSTSQVRKEKQAKKQSKRQMEPPTQGKQEGSKRSSHHEKKRKENRKTPKKTQVRPQDEKPNTPMDPDGKVIPRTRYKKRGMERDTQSFSDLDKSEEKCHQNDPPMVIGGHLEVEESPIEKNDSETTELPIGKKNENENENEKKKKKKKKRKKKKETKERSRNDLHPRNHERRFEDGGSEIVTNSVVSSRMDRGNERWSVPVDEINVIDRDQSDGVHREQYDPWEEVPCSWCCRYLPHTLVVATTQAYRLDRADEKENSFIDSKH